MTGPTANDPTRISALDSSADEANPAGPDTLSVPPVTSHQPEDLGDRIDEAIVQRNVEPTTDLDEDMTSDPDEEQVVPGTVEQTATTTSDALIGDPAEVSAPVTVIVPAAGLGDSGAFGTPTGDPSTVADREDDR